MEEQNTNQEQEPVMQTDTSDAEKNKVVAIIGYIFPIIFFIPLLSDEGKKSTFAMFHANQHLNLLLASIALMVVNIIPILGQIVWLIGSIAIFVFAIMGLIGAASGKMKPLPLIGGFKLLK